MKNILCLLMCVVLILGALPLSAAAASDTPLIAMTYTPAYGESEHFEGQIFTEDGSSFEPSDYRIALYLQLYAGDTYWVKPSFAVPYTEPDADGTFSVRYDTGGSDEKATLIHIMLIPSSYTPTSSFSETKARALDYVLITRSPDGEVKVSPERSVPDAADFSKTSGIGTGEMLAVNVGFYTDGSAPGSPLSGEQISRQLTAVSDFADTVRFYGSAGELEKAYTAADRSGLSVIGTAWLSGDEKADMAELDALIGHCSDALVSIACVGSETQLRGDLTQAKLIEYIQYVRDGISGSGIPVTTAEPVEILAEHPELRDACDILMANYYPYWQGVSVTEAAANLDKEVSGLLKLADGKELIISETGWPTGGEQSGSAAAGEKEAALYFEQVRAWSAYTGIPVIWFDAADEPWKTEAEGECGAHWGLMTNEMELKPCYKNTEFFR